ncbi:MAG TPA: TonB-dependent receptor plug domain-containing protein [Allosphingosinicella sp.]
MRRQAAFLLAGAALAIAAPAGAAGTDGVESLKDLSIEQLAQLPVRSVSKQAEPISAAPASIFVITADDILRSSATSLPDVLALAPNLEIQHLDARQYAISARGFNGYESANKLLVLIDGRSVYTPLHSGVIWELQSPLLEDIGQIEVVSGPGGTLYGPNAVNGVINVTSKDARDTVGGLIRGSAGDREQSLGLRYGAKLGSDGAIRFYADGYDRDGMPAGPAGDVDDHFKGWQSGFRADWGAQDHFTVQGDIFSQTPDSFDDDNDHGRNLLARWTHKTGEDSAFQLQAYYDDYWRRITLVTDRLQTLDAEAQYNLRLGANGLVFGAGVRTTRDLFLNGLNAFALVPDSERLWIGNAFAQDRIALGRTLDLIAGLKLEESSFAGLEALPNLRLAYHPSDKILFWTAVSRAVRTPSRIDRQLTFPGLVPPALDFQSEKLVAYEAGYRGQPSRTTSLSVSFYYNVYDDIRTTEALPGGTTFRLMNGLAGETYGVEAWLTRQLMPWWRVSLGAATIGKHFHMKPGHADLTNDRALGTDPGHQLSARSSIDLTRRLHFDVAARAVGGIKGTPPVPAYVEADARLGWDVGPFELYVAGENLLHKTHLESNDPSRAQRIARSVMAGTRIRF